MTPYVKIIFGICRAVNGICRLAGFDCLNEFDFEDIFEVYFPSLSRFDFVNFPMFLEDFDGLGRGNFLCENG